MIDRGEFVVGGDFRRGLLGLSGSWIRIRRGVGVGILGRGGSGAGIWLKIRLGMGGVGRGWVGNSLGIARGSGRGRWWLNAAIILTGG